MIIEIDRTTLPEIFHGAFDNWKTLFMNNTMEYHKNKPFIGLDFKGQDPNYKSYNSLEEYLNWYSDFSLKPHKDDAFYSREFTYLLTTLNPAIVVEFGTNFGIGAFMIPKLCKSLKSYCTVDCAEFHTFPEENRKVTQGHIAKINNMPVNYIVGNSWETKIPEKFNFCFIDGGHDEETVYKDSLWAWQNKDMANYLIVWHDYRKDYPEMEGLIKSINKFSNEHNIPVYKMKDSSTVWTYKRSV